MPISWPPPGYDPGGYQDNVDIIAADIVNSLVVFLDGLETAYDVAVANGFVGSQAAWLDSLVGDDGARGADGQGVYVINYGTDPNSLPPTVPDGSVILERPQFPPA